VRTVRNFHQVTKHCSIVVCILAALVSCGDGVSNAWRGSAGNALLIDQNGFNNNPSAQLWVGFTSATEFQKLSNTAVNQTLYVEGIVVPDSRQSLRFFLDPNSTSLPEGLIPELVQPMRTVRDNLNTWSGQHVAFLVKVQETAK
jgi:hypothetical protein